MHAGLALNIISFISTLAIETYYSVCSNIECPNDYYRIGNCSDYWKGSWIKAILGSCSGTNNGYDCRICSYVFFLYYLTRYRRLFLTTGIWNAVKTSIGVANVMVQSMSTLAILKQNVRLVSILRWTLRFTPVNQRFSCNSGYFISPHSDYEVKHDS